MKKIFAFIICLTTILSIHAKTAKERQAEIRVIYKETMELINARAEEPRVMNKISIKMVRNEAAVGMVEYTWDLFFTGDTDETGEQYQLHFARSKHHYLESAMPDTDEEYLFDPKSSRLLFYFCADKNNSIEEGEEWHAVTSEERYYYNADGSYNSRIVKATDDTGKAVANFKFGTERTKGAEYLTRANTPKTLFKTLSPNQKY